MTKGDDLPAPSVLEAFGLHGTPARLPGGQGGSVLVDGAVLKRTDDPAEAHWIQGIAAELRPEGCRIAPPLATTSGAWVFDDWTANEHLPGLRPAAPDWGTITAAGRELAAAIADLPDVAGEAPPTRTHRWARADRCAWGEERVALGPEAADLVDQLIARTGPDDDAAQVIHADLAGNVHLDAAGVPVVLDLSLVVRPLAWADAIVVVDAVCWHGADLALATSFAADDTGADLLARALVFRLVAEQLGPLAGSPGSLAPYQRALAALTS